MLRNYLLTSIGNLLENKPCSVQPKDSFVIPVTKFRNWNNVFT